MRREGKGREARLAEQLALALDRVRTLEDRCKCQDGVLISLAGRLAHYMEANRQLEKKLAGAAPTEPAP